VNVIKLLKGMLNLPAQLVNWYTLQSRNIVWKSYPTIRGVLSVGGSGKLLLGRSVHINSSNRSNPVGAQYRTSIHISPRAIISIGDNVGVSNTLFYAWTSIIVEDDVMIGGGCQIYDTDFHSIRYEDRVHNGDEMTRTAPVVIKKGAFIGTSTIILKGVTIGERSVVAAGSVVSKSIPADEIWGGNPCRFIKTLP
jgi:acetyltransferase-like isoleucine patch superfamily enzyme